MIFEIVVEQDALGGAFGVLILTVLEGPEKGPDSEKAEQQGNRHQEQKSRHESFLPPASRRALRVTISDDPDMASAAISGVTNPIIARGAATAL